LRKVSTSLLERGMEASNCLRPGHAYVVGAIYNKPSFNSVNTTLDATLGLSACYGDT